MATIKTSRKPLAGNRRSHSCRATKHMQKVNTQNVILPDGTKAKLSAREIRTLKKAA